MSVSLKFNNESFAHYSRGLSPVPLPQPVLAGSSTDRGPAFRITTVNAVGVAVVTVSGDLDLLTADQFEQALATVLYDPVSVLLVDLTDTGFLGAVAMTTLVSAHNLLVASGSELVVVAHGPATARPMLLVGLSDTIRVVSSIEVAFRDLHITR